MTNMSRVTYSVFGFNPGASCNVSQRTMAQILAHRPANLAALSVQMRYILVTSRFGSVVTLALRRRSISAVSSRSRIRRMVRSIAATPRWIREWHCAGLFGRLPYVNLFPQRTVRTQ
jgi:hypothetical protein